MLKVMEYNILYGFHNIATKRFEEHRLRLAQQIVKSENPDILILTECCFGHPTTIGQTLDYQTLFGYKHYYYGADNHEWGKCILSKFPLDAKSLPFSNGKDGQVQKRFICSMIDIGGKKLHLDVIHPAVETTDEEKIAVMSGHIAAVEPPYLLAGDFNSLSDEDHYDYSVLLPAFQSFAKEHARAMLDNLMNRKFILYLRSVHLHDAFPIGKRTLTIPTNLISTDKSSGTRIDHFFVSKWSVRVKDAYTVRDARTEHASDHYPIVCVLELD